MKRVRQVLVSGVVVLATSFHLPAFAEVTLYPLFSEGAVLQQKMKVPIWGTARAGEMVMVKFQNRTMTALAKDGHWQVVFPPLRAGGPFTLEVKVKGDNPITRTNILVGEVWVCSGQSNMQMGLAGCENGQDAIAKSADPLLRLFTVPLGAADEPQRDIKGNWTECGPATVPGFSAVAYYFGRDLRQAHKVPVGLIHTSWGGSPAQTWVPRRYLEGDPQLRLILEAYAKLEQAYPQRLAQYRQAEPELKKKYEEAVAQAKREGKQPPPPPAPPMDWSQWAHRPTSLYNAMIAPLQPFTIRGAIWYQGESNVGEAYQYRTLFPTVIRAWRETWGEGDFPFLFVQLAPCGNSAYGDSTWAELREAQLLTSQQVPKTAMAVITDAGNCVDIHPRLKEPVGARLALAARAVAYGERLEFAGPVYHGCKIQGDRVTLTFTHAGHGLLAKNGDLRGCTIAGADRKFVPAKAEIAGNKLVVSSPAVPQPVAVRYGWADCPDVNLYNQEGLPASPFRTDDFPMVTKPK